MNATPLHKSSVFSNNMRGEFNFSAILLWIYAAKLYQAIELRVPTRI